MTTNDIKALIQTEQYDFLRKDPHLGKNVILLGLGGSHSYGMSRETSDVDVRGIAMNTKQDILLGRTFEQVINTDTDTQIFAFDKTIQLLTDNNPNLTELLYLPMEQYLYLHPVGIELLSKRNMFLSKRIYQKFGGYAREMLSRLENMTMRDLDQTGEEKQILRSLQNAESVFPDKYFTYPQDAIKLYIDKSVQKGMDTEIFMDIQLSHYPVRDYKGMCTELQNIVKNYRNIGKRGKSAIRRGKVGKHAMLLTRIILLGTQLLKEGYMDVMQPKERELLLSIRNGKYTEGNHMTKEFYSIIDSLMLGMESAYHDSTLPDKPDYQAIDDFVYNVHHRIVLGLYENIQDISDMETD